MCTFAVRTPSWSLEKLRLLTCVERVIIDNHNINEEEGSNLDNSSKNNLEGTTMMKNLFSKTVTKISSIFSGVIVTYSFVISGSSAQAALIAHK